MFFPFLFYKTVSKKEKEKERKEKEKERKEKKRKKVGTDYSPSARINSQ